MFLICCWICQCKTCGNGGATVFIYCLILLYLLIDRWIAKSGDIFITLGGCVQEPFVGWVGFLLKLLSGCPGWCWLCRRLLSMDLGGTYSRRSCERCCWRWPRRSRWWWSTSRGWWAFVGWFFTSCPLGHLCCSCSVVNQPVVAEGVAGLQVIGLAAVHLLTPLNRETGAILHDYLLQMHGHGVTSPWSS